MFYQNEPSLAPQLKGFSIERKLGTGTYASVYKALNKNKNEICAIKCIKKSGLNKASTDNLLSEIKILKEVKHEFIVQLIDFQWDENYIYLIMEYCPGGDLSSFIRCRRTIPERYVRRFVQQIASALKHLHSIGIAHMDLKPQNILLTSTNNPSLKLADFGFAQYMKENKVSQTLRGSPLYMAPEILKNKVYDSKVDLWSVGVILHEVIFGYAPFVSQSFEELKQKILSDDQIKIPSHVMLSETCKDLLKRLLQRNPEERIKFEEFFGHPFVDMEHMPSNRCLPRSNEILRKAVQADENKNYKLAQKLYLQSIEYLIPAIQFENDAVKKQEIREKAKLYLKRAEEMSGLNSRPSSGDKNDSIPISVITQNFTNLNLSHSTPKSPNMNASSLTCVSSFSNAQPSQTLNSQNIKKLDLLNLTKEDPQAQNAVKLCFDADQKFKIGTCDLYEEIYSQYENAISVLLPFLKNLPKDENSSVLKKNIESWLSKAEYLKKQLNAKSLKPDFDFFQAKENIKEEDEDKNVYTKNCTIQ
ncbi:serine threonine- kinase ULK3 [Brachionus plicatilis]|uniref:Serine/threonine-protein kinase ULK3 n=1 Tax=Brachionus plicatilis TaxID=10195 RepID=A0A3M7SBU6_BRAPC|nr:serine threonine- kinase ULK3 [Brachionus plicatilis]